MVQSNKSIEGLEDISLTNKALKNLLIEGIIGNSEDDKKQKAVLLKYIEQTLDEISNGNSNNLSSVGDDLDDESALNSLLEGTKGLDRTNLYISNGIPFDVFIKLMENALKAALANINVSKTVKLSSVGLYNNKTDGSAKDSDFVDSGTGGLIGSISRSIIASGEQQAMTTIMDATASLSQAVGAVVGVAAGAFIKTKMDMSEEKDNVTKLENAVSEVENTPSDLFEVTIGDNNAEVSNNQDFKNAISKLKSGEHDFTKANRILNDDGEAVEGDHFFGSADVSKENAKRAKLVAQEQADNHPDIDPNREEYNKGIFLVEGEDVITVEDAIRYASPAERRAIKEKLQKQLKDAKDALSKKEDKVGQRAQMMQKTLSDALGTAGAGTSKMASQASIIEKSKQDASTEISRTMRDGFQTLDTKSKASVDENVQRIAQMQQALQQIIQALNSLGRG
ncbi:MAG: hypothetical protein S4CHLAM20_07490 [Chlamydiia bacterium]|nr:hypothetical protein [Chlamydiia bacterium]